jgi:hypothetical protein
LDLVVVIGFLRSLVNAHKMLMVGVAAAGGCRYLARACAWD